MTISEENTTVLTERVGIVGVVALVVGNAVSIPIFVLPGPLAGSVGPGLIVAVVLAAAPAFLAVLYNAQLGSAMPVAGGLYVYITRLIAPFWGFLVPFSLPIVTWAALLFAAIGFAEYVRFFIDLPVAPLIYAFLVFVLLVNLLGIKAVARAQILFVVMLFLSIGMFIIPGIFAVDTANYTPVFPNGLGPLGLAFVALYYPYLGFGLLTELGEEIENPGKTIPLALISGVIAVALIYLLFVSVLVGVMPWRQLGETEAAVAVASREFLPWWGSTFVAAGAFFAVLTTVNTTLLVSSRTVMRAARDGILPRRLSKIHPRFGTPYVSILLLGVPPFFIAAFIQEEVIGLSVFIALATLTAMFFSAIALWNLPVEFPDHYQNATLRLRRYRGLLFAVVSGMLVSAGMWVVTLTRLPLAGLFLVVWFGIGYVYYRYKFRKEGNDTGELYMRMVTLDEHEEAFAEEQTYEDAQEGDD